MLRRVPSGVPTEPTRGQEVDDELRLAHVERLQQFGEVRLVTGQQRRLAVGQEEQPLCTAVDRLDHVEHRLGLDHLQLLEREIVLLSDQRVFGRFFGGRANDNCPLLLLL